MHKEDNLDEMQVQRRLRIIMRAFIFLAIELIAFTILQEIGIVWARTRDVTSIALIWAVMYLYTSCTCRGIFPISRKVHRVLNVFLALYAPISTIILIIAAARGEALWQQGTFTSGGVALCMSLSYFTAPIAYFIYVKKEKTELEED